MPGFCIILSSASGGLGSPRTPRLKGRSLCSLHFPSILKKIPSIQNLNETTDIDPPTHGISTPSPLPMVYQPPNPWYFDPPAHGISTPLPMVYQTLSYGIMNSSLLVEMRGVQFTMRGFKIQ